MGLQDLRAAGSSGLGFSALHVFNLLYRSASRFSFLAFGSKARGVSFRQLLVVVRMHGCSAASGNVCHADEIPNVWSDFVLNNELGLTVPTSALLTMYIDIDRKNVLHEDSSNIHILLGMV